MAKAVVTRSVTAENLFTDAVKLTGYFNLSMSGTWEATVTIQRAFDGGSTWLDVAEYTDSSEEYGFECEGGIVYRVGVKTGDFTSGTVVLRLSQ